jgi:hypothetical protein
MGLVIFCLPDFVSYVRKYTGKNIMAKSMIYRIMEVANIGCRALSNLSLIAIAS